MKKAAGFEQEIKETVLSNLH